LSQNSRFHTTHPVTKSIIVFYQLKVLHVGPQALQRIVKTKILANRRKKEANALDVSGSRQRFFNTLWAVCQLIESGQTQLFTPHESTFVDQASPQMLYFDFHLLLNQGRSSGNRS